MSSPGDGPPAENQTHEQRALAAAPADEQKGEPKPVAAPSAETGTGDSATAAPTSASSLRAAGSSQKQKQRLDKQPHEKKLPPGTAPGQANWEYKRRMPKQRATAWPSSILSDPDVLSLDDEGRFVLCKVCHVHYAVHGGKKPKPVIMNSIFRTRAWEVHKERTNSHRMQKRALESTARPELHAPPSSPVVTQQQQDQAQQRQRQQQLQLQQALRQQQFQSRQQVPNHGNYVSSEARHNALQQSRNEAVAFHHVATRDADSAPHTPPSHPLPSLQRVQSEGKANESSAQSRAPMLANNLMSEQDLRRRVSGNERLFIRPAGTVSMRGGTKHAAQVLTEEHSQEGWTSGSKGSSLSQQPDQGQSNDSNGENPPAQPNDAEPPPPPPPNDDSESSPPLQRDSDSKHKERSRKRRTRERDEESESSKEEAIEASSRAMRDQYWRTMREVYSLSRVKRGSGGSGVRSSSKDLARKKKKKKRSAENGKSTNREDMGDNPLRTMIVHDPTLINAIDRLAGVLSKQLSEMRSTDTSATRHFMSTLTTEVSEMRRQQEHAMERMIDLGERHLKVMEEILQCKLRKEQRALDGPRVNSNSAQHQQQQQP